MVGGALAQHLTVAERPSRQRQLKVESCQVGTVEVRYAVASATESFGGGGRSDIAEVFVRRLEILGNFKARNGEKWTSC